MSTSDDLAKFIKLKTRLIQTSTNIITPTLGKGNHLHYSYLRVLFIAKTIDYLAEMSIFSHIQKIDGSLITDAVCETSKLLGISPSENSLYMLLYEMSEGLCLLDREDMGSVEVENPAYLIDKTKPRYITKHLGFKYSLSEKGMRSYQNQEYQILAAELQSARISRFVSYSAVIIAFIALVISFFR